MRVGQRPGMYQAWGAPFSLQRPFSSRCCWNCPHFRGKRQISLVKARRLKNQISRKGLREGLPSCSEGEGPCGVSLEQPRLVSCSFFRALVGTREGPPPVPSEPGSFRATAQCVCPFRSSVWEGAFRRGSWRPPATACGVAKTPSEPRAQHWLAVWAGSARPAPAGAPDELGPCRRRGQPLFGPLSCSVKAGSEISLLSLFPRHRSCCEHRGAPKVWCLLLGAGLEGLGWAAIEVLGREPCEGGFVGRNGDHLCTCPCFPPRSVGVCGLQIKALSVWGALLRYRGCWAAGTTHVPP